MHSFFEKTMRRAHDWHFNSVSGIRGGFVVVSLGMIGGIDLEFYGWYNDFRGCGEHIT